MRVMDGCSGVKPPWSSVAAIWLFILICDATAYIYGSGCSSGKTEALQDERHPAVSACAGSWQSHVGNWSDACAHGWQVCSCNDGVTLNSLTLKDKLSTPGCYLYDGIQQCGTCHTCADEDSYAGLGQGCPHQTYTEDTCIPRDNGAVDKTEPEVCKVTSSFATGVLCCKIPGVPPQILVEPQELTHVTSGVTFVLSCQAMGSPTPSVRWYKEGKVLQNNISRIAVFDSGYLLISAAQPEDTGEYTCMVDNVAGTDKAVARVVVTDYATGCADGTTDGLYGYEDIQACRGTWQGHVKRAKPLCASGWRVCSSRHSNLVNLLTWDDVITLPGCYAYNAANMLNRCTRCHQQNLAGVGKHCGKVRRSAKSCLAQGRIDVYRNRYQDGCNYQDGLTTGVLCCKKLSKQEVAWVKSKKPKCTPKCSNGGMCVETGRCKCPPGYKGAWCQNPICAGGCIPNSICVKPGVCECKQGYTGKKCRRRHLACPSACLNGGQCRHGQCKCPVSHRGDICQIPLLRKPIGEVNRTE